jgi:hypothetical protein
MIRRALIVVASVVCVQSGCSSEEDPGSSTDSPCATDAAVCKGACCNVVGSMFLVNAPSNCLVAVSGSQSIACVPSGECSPNLIEVCYSRGIDGGLEVLKLGKGWSGAAKLGYQECEAATWNLPLCDSGT